MKNRFLGFGTAFLVLAATACNNGSSTTTTDSTTVSSDNSATQSTSSNNASTRSTTVALDPSASYVDLKTGKQVKLRVDTVTKYIVDVVTNQPVMYFVNPATNDTFDRSGRLVSRALIRDASGDYSVDESRLSVDTDDNASSSTNSDSADVTADESATTTGSTKTKIKDDKFKQKTENSKIKVKDDKVKVKTE